MIIVNARIQMTPEALAALKAAIITMQDATLQEEGCEDYSFSVELANLSAVRITERWASKAALTAHFKTQHMASFQARHAGPSTPRGKRPLLRSHRDRDAAMNGAQAHIRQRRVLPGRVHPFGLPMNGLQAHIRQRRSRARRQWCGGRLGDMKSKA